MNPVDHIKVQQRLNQFLKANGLKELTWSKVKTVRLQELIDRDHDFNYWPFEIKFFVNVPVPPPGIVSGHGSVELNLFYNSNYNTIPKELLGLCQQATKIQVKFVNFCSRWEMPFGMKANTLQDKSDEYSVPDLI